MTAGRLVYRVAELAAFLGWSEDTIRREIKGGRLIAHKLRADTVVLEADLLAWLGNLPTLEISSEVAAITAEPTPIRANPSRARVQRLVSIVPQARRDGAL